MEKLYLNFKNDKELFEFIRKADISDTPELKDVFEKYTIESIDIDSALQNINDDVLILDARSENEFETSHLPNAINFSVLNNNERHFVGNLYKNYSQKSAVWLAIQYASEKYENLKESLTSIPNFESKQIYVYCWRGGGRSKYLSKMILDLFPEKKVNFIKGGFKSYRHCALKFFESEIHSYNFIELTGLTGCNKSKLIELCSTEIPSINLELAARHQSSLFGKIPYQIRGFSEVKDQSSFENNLYNEFLKCVKPDSNDFPFLIESESRKIGNFVIPPNLYQKISEAKSILIESTLEERINVIKEDYFMDDMRGLPLILKVFTEKSDFFKQQLSNEIYSEMLEALENENAYKFIKYMLVKYYDVRYKDKGKKPLLVINRGDLKHRANELIHFFNEYKYAD